MFEFFKNIFSSNSVNSITFLEFYKKMISWSESKVYPYDFNLPEAISFPESFWNDITKLHKETLSDGLEREISLFWADGELIVTSVVKGDTSSVKSNHSISVKYVNHPTRHNYFRKEIYLDGSILKKVDVFYAKAPKKVEVKYLFNLHTHPAHTDVNGEIYFNLFSNQDLKSLASSGVVITGLVADKLWLLVRTSNTDMVNLLPDGEISVESLKSRMKMGIYCANFFKKAVRQ